ncbi:VOC family protein [Bartonella sp. HY329]|uniref:VOC family protein n=1 Tax=unclassified Bartonella TaxID=2645622 RepID=UPI0021CA182A|nr:MULTISPECIES: VOC family protein [unclassified Bartonella]UXM95886.1 VOC family protein [Bartonella sp. HY329]UXN10211.1 VOC family protein [Bartonella sp. HY328]
MAKFVHSMIRVLEEKRSVDFYQKAFNLKVEEKIEFDDFTLIYLSNEENSFELELTVNKGRTEPYNLGDGYGHAAFVVDDIDATHARFERDGLAPRKLVQLDQQGKKVARFFFVADPDGYQIEVIEKGGRFS